MDNKITLDNISGLTVGISTGGKTDRLITKVSFICETPEDLYTLLSMQKKHLPLQVSIFTQQRELPLEDKKK